MANASVNGKVMTKFKFNDRPIVYLQQLDSLKFHSSSGLDSLQEKHSMSHLSPAKPKKNDKTLINMYDQH